MKLLTFSFGKWRMSSISDLMVRKGVCLTGTYLKASEAERTRASLICFVTYTGRNFSSLGGRQAPSLLYFWGDFKNAIRATIYLPYTTLGLFHS